MYTRNILIVIVLLVLAGGIWFATSRYTERLFGGGEPGITYKNADSDMIVVENIRPGVTVLPRFTVQGKARGTWYFEASFPVEVVAQDGRKLAMTSAQAEGEWMTKDFVPFTAQMELTEAYSGPATLILHKDNPSGESSRDASIEMQIEVMAIQ